MRAFGAILKIKIFDPIDPFRSGYKIYLTAQVKVFGSKSVYSQLGAVWHHFWKINILTPSNR